MNGGIQMIKMLLLAGWFIVSLLLDLAKDA